MMIFIIVALFIAAYLFDFLPIIRENNKKLSWLYGVLCLASFIVLILHEAGVAVPSPAKPIKYLITSVLKLK